MSSETVHYAFQIYMEKFTCFGTVQKRSFFSLLRDFLLLSFASWRVRVEELHKTIENVNDMKLIAHQITHGSGMHHYASFSQIFLLLMVIKKNINQFLMNSHFDKIFGKLRYLIR